MDSYNNSLNKLVRDRVPEIIEAEGKTAHYRILPADELSIYLLEKLVEEAEELKRANGNKEDLMKEIADVKEVLAAIVERYGLSEEEIEQLRIDRHEKRGGFETGIFLESVE